MRGGVLRPFRGVHKKYLPHYLAMGEHKINLKRISPKFIACLVTQHRSVTWAKLFLVVRGSKLNHRQNVLSNVNGSIPSKVLPSGRQPVYVAQSKLIHTVLKP